mmetsp:Transcript_1360/g.4723  ORF Transcript_1360/g.4723 Transcript_1360/m.4723 type:complete len:209 (+) Transcript_1360:1427-2053(+)
MQRVQVLSGGSPITQRQRGDHPSRRRRRAALELGGVRGREHRRVVVLERKDGLLLVAACGAAVASALPLCALARHVLFGAHDPLLDGRAPRAQNAPTDRSGVTPLTQGPEGGVQAVGRQGGERTLAWRRTGLSASKYLAPSRGDSWYPAHTANSWRTTDAATVTFSEAVPRPYCAMYTNSSQSAICRADRPVPSLPIRKAAGPRKGLR